VRFHTRCTEPPVFVVQSNPGQTATQPLVKPSNTLSHLLDEELLDAQVKVLVVVLVQEGVDKGVDLSLVLSAIEMGWGLRGVYVGFE
jgi:hypothetical protein